jgi:hypothetical protein
MSMPLNGDGTDGPAVGQFGCKISVGKGAKGQGVARGLLDMQLHRSCAIKIAEDAFAKA